MGILPPSAGSGGVFPVNVAVRQGRLQLRHSLRIDRILVLPCMDEDPQPSQGLQVLHRADIVDQVVDDVQVQQVRHVLQAGDIPDLVVEQLQVFQVLQAADRRNVRRVACGDDQHPQLRHLIQERQIVKGVVPDVQRVQVLAVFDDFHLLAGMPGRIIPVQGGEGCIIRPQRMPAAAFILAEAHGHAELDARKPLMDFLHLLIPDGYVEHVHLLQVRELFKEGAESLVVRQAVQVEIQVFRFRIRAESIKSQRFPHRRCGETEAENQHQDPADCFHVLPPCGCSLKVIFEKGL